MCIRDRPCSFKSCISCIFVFVSIKVSSLVYCSQYTKSDEPLTPPVIKLAAGDVKKWLPDSVKNFLPSHVKKSLPHDVKKILPRHVKNSLPCGCKITLPRTILFMWNLQASVPLTRVWGIVIPSKITTMNDRRDQELVIRESHSGSCSSENFSLYFSKSHIGILQGKE